MCKFSVMDVAAMQECLEGYKKLVEWIPPLNEDEENMQLARLQIINHLSVVCENILQSEKEKQNG